MSGHQRPVVVATQGPKPLRPLVVRAVLEADRIHVSRDGAVSMTIAEWFAVSQEVLRQLGAQLRETTTERRQ